MALLLQTIVGSEIFNQLVICAGAVFAAKSGSLELDRALVTREVCFYALSIGLLWYVLHDIEQIDGEEHIFISFFDACLLVSAYIAYVLVCANFEAIVKLFSCKVADDDPDSVRVRKWSMFWYRIFPLTKYSFDFSFACCTIQSKLTSVILKIFRLSRLASLILSPISPTPFMSLKVERIACLEMPGTTRTPTFSQQRHQPIPCMVVWGAVLPALDTVVFWKSR